MILNNAQNIKYGSLQVKKVMRGASLIWQLPFEFIINTANLSTGSSNDNQFKLPLVSSLPLNAIVDWGDGNTDNITVFNQTETLHTYASVGIYTIKITGDLSGWQFNNGGDRNKMLNIANWGVLNISVSAGFYGCLNMTCSATDAPTISSPIGALRLFFSAISFNGAIGNWDMSNVTNIRDMLRGATAFNQNIGNWNVSNVNTATEFMGAKTAANFSAENLDAIYNEWSSRPVQPNIVISFGTIKYTAAGQAGRDILTGAPNNWTITDGGI
jgi:hypothetical protein